MKDYENEKTVTEVFSQTLEGMDAQCGSCKFFEYQYGISMCTKHDMWRSKKDKKCEDWRYFA